MERLLLERLLQRKELRLAAMLEKMAAQAGRLEELEARQRCVEELPGFWMFRKVAELVARGWGLLASTVGWLLGLARGLYSGLASLPSQLAKLLLPSTLTKGKEGVVKELAIEPTDCEEHSEVFRLRSAVKEPKIRRKVKRGRSGNEQ